MSGAFIKLYPTTAYIHTRILRLKKTLLVDSCKPGPYTHAEASSMSAFLIFEAGDTTHPHPPRVWRFSA